MKTKWPMMSIVLMLVAACGGDTTATTTTPAPGSTHPAGEVGEISHRVLVDGIDEGGQPWTTGLVETRRDLDTLVPGADVDWDGEVVFRFTLAESSSCPFADMTRLEFSEPDLRLYPVVPLIGEPEICTDDAMPHTIVVAVTREDLPDGEFSIWVDGEEPLGGVSEGVTRFGAGELDEPGPSAIEPLNADGDLPVGEKRIARDVTTHCGLERIYREIIGEQWALAENGGGQLDYIPPEWRSAVDGEQIDLILERMEEEVLLVTAAGTDHSLRYTPAEEFVGCD